ncbi:hypothetical protein GCM10009122_36510 [Fulvivirga kasyanovii]|uniref:T9SS type A sorting domain-containing protein n=1 Tax=Fulvivirga kasyanovii TaxID=396812 RepID=A0ABW9RZ77_9BACT|nr:T9SS type A sorting domain-containing protein [Fulvivirga kasyanovii]MTI29140.1 T9SS type A sorting domain-containing protein [Fulvivirga kasyanovii]
MNKRIPTLLAGTMLSLAVCGQGAFTNNSAKISPRERVTSIEGFNKPAQADRQQDEELQKLDSIIEYNFNERDNTWDEKFRKEHYQYNIDFQLNQYVLSSWSAGQNQWDKLMKESFVYNPDGKLSGYQSYIFSDANWKNDLKEEYSYDIRNQLKQSLRYVYKQQAEEWLFAEKWRYHYSDEGVALVDSLFWYQETSQEWVLKEKIEYEYINDKIHYVTRSKWDKENLQWIPSEEKWYLYTYGEWLLYLVSGSKWNNNDWELVTREYYGYDDDNNFDNYSIVSRDLNAEGWDSLLKERLTFDYQVSKDALLLPYFQDRHIPSFDHHKLITKKLFDLNFDTREDEQYREVKYYYSSSNLILSSKKTLEGNAKVYPNPASNYITFINPASLEGGLLEIWDSSGTLVLKTEMRNEEQLDISTLPFGLYIYHIVFNNKVASGKLMVH